MKEFLSMIIRFMLSIAFRDCSILVSLHKLGSSSEEAETLLGKQLGYEMIGNLCKCGDELYRSGEEKLYAKIGLIDFKMKTYHHIDKYFKSHRELFKLYWDYKMMMDGKK